MSFPINVSKTDKVDTGRHITTNVNISDDGRVDGLVTLENAVAATGFKGGSVVLVGDASGNILWGSRTHKTGVNAAGFSRNKKATEDWVEFIPSAIIGNVETAEIVNKLTPDDGLWEQRIDQAVAAAEKISGVIAALSA